MATVFDPVSRQAKKSTEESLSMARSRALPVVCTPSSFEKQYKRLGLAAAAPHPLRPRVGESERRHAKREIERNR